MASEIDVKSVIRFENFKTRTYQHGETYVGELNEADRKHGIGVLRTADGKLVVGGFLEGVLTGPCLIESRGLKYVGEAVANVFEGEGAVEILGEKQFRYVGQFKRGGMTGFGRMTFADGGCGVPFHEGQFENGILKRTLKVSEFISELEKSVSELEQYLRGILATVEKQDVEPGKPSASAAAALTTVSEKEPDLINATTTAAEYDEVITDSDQL